MHIKRGWMENRLLGLTESTVGTTFSQIHFVTTLRRKKGKIKYYLMQFLMISTNAMVKAIIPVTKCHLTWRCRIVYEPYLIWEAISLWQVTDFVLYLAATNTGWLTNGSLLTIKTWGRHVTSEEKKKTFFSAISVRKILRICEYLVVYAQSMKLDYT